MCLSCRNHIMVFVNAENNFGADWRPKESAFGEVCGQSIDCTVAYHTIAYHSKLFYGRALRSLYSQYRTTVRPNYGSRNFFGPYCRL